MASAKVGSVYAEIRARLDKHERDLKKAHTQTITATKKIQRSVNKINFDSPAKSLERFGSVFKTAIAGIAVGTVFKEIITAASDLEEVTSKFEVVFAGQIKTVEKWADTLQESYLMSTRESKQYLSSIQDLLVPMGMQADAAAKMSFETVKLAADLGSFNNVKTATVIADIQSALVGNFETMKKYGVVLNVATVNQEALTSGLVKSKDEINASIKAQAAYNIILKGSAAAIGDVERTSDSWANQMKQLKASIEDLKATLGSSGLLGTMTALLKVTNSLIKAMEIAFGPEEFNSQAEALLDTRKKIIASLEKQLKMEEQFGSIHSEHYADLKSQLDIRKKTLELAQQQFKLDQVIAAAFKEVDEAEEGLKARSLAPSTPQTKIPEPKKPKDTIAIKPDFWQIKEKDRYDVQRRVLEYDIQAEKEAAEAKDSILEYSIGKDFWQMQAEERYEVQSRSLDALIESEKESSNAMIRLSERTAASMQNNFSTYFYDVLTLEMKTFSDYFESFVDSIARVWSDLMAQMATEWIFGDLAKVGGGGGLLGEFKKLFSTTSSSTTAVAIPASNGVMAGGAGSVNYGFDNGGYIGEGISGIGRSSGKSYEFHPNEYVIPASNKVGGGGGGVVINFRNESGTPMTAEQGPTRFYHEKMITDVVIKRKVQSRGFRDALRM